MNFYARLCDFLTNILTLKKILKYFFTFSFNDILNAFRVKVLYISVFQYSGDRKNIDNHLLKPFFDMTNHRGLRPTNLSKLKLLRTSARTGLHRRGSEQSRRGASS